MFRLDNIDIIRNKAIQRNLSHSVHDVIQPIWAYLDDREKMRNPS